jgi:metal-sulfur cluster biosynthetic enzyme
MTTDAGTTVERVREALKRVIDPEIGVNIVDLGLVYSTAVAAGDVRIAMTMTSPACPLGESIAAEAERVVAKCVPDVRSVTVDLVWEPAWQPSMMSDAAKAQLGWS